MTGCEQRRPELGAYVLGGLEPVEHDAVEAHLAGCVRCTDEMGELAELPALLRLAEEAPQRAPADLRQRVLNDDRQPRRRVSLVLAAALTALGVLVGAGAAVVVGAPPPADVTLQVRGDAPVGIVGEAALWQVDAGVRVDLDLTGVRSSDEGYYHAWLHRGDLRVSAGTFVGPPDGTVQVQLLCGGRLEDYDQLTVTWHPFGEDEPSVAVAAALHG